MRATRRRNSSAMESLERQASLEEDLYIPPGTPDFLDHFGETNDVQLVNGTLIDLNCNDANYQKFIRIASAQEMEEFDTFYDAAEEAGSYSTDSGVQDLSQLDPASRAKAEEALKAELASTEAEIATLRQVLSSKVKRMQELKRKLGITVWKEFKDDMEQGIRNIQESPAFQKTSQTIKVAGEKTTEALHTVGASVTKKFEEVKNSSAFKTIEEKVGTAYTSVKTKVVPQAEEGHVFADTLARDGKGSAGTPPKN